MKMSWTCKVYVVSPPLFLFCFINTFWGCFFFVHFLVCGYAHDKHVLITKPTLQVFFCLKIRLQTSCCFTRLRLALSFQNASIHAIIYWGTKYITEFLRLYPLFPSLIYLSYLGQNITGRHTFHLKLSILWRVWGELTCSKGHESYKDATVMKSVS